MALRFLSSPVKHREWRLLILHFSPLWGTLHHIEVVTYRCSLGRLVLSMQLFVSNHIQTHTSNWRSETMVSHMLRHTDTYCVQGNWIHGRKKLFWPTIEKKMKSKNQRKKKTATIYSKLSKKTSINVLHESLCVESHKNEGFRSKWC